RSAGGAGQGDLPRGAAARVGGRRRRTPPRESPRHHGHRLPDRRPQEGARRPSRALAGLPPPGREGAAVARRLQRPHRQRSFRRVARFARTEWTIDLKDPTPGGTPTPGDYPWSSSVPGRAESSMAIVVDTKDCTAL